MSLDVRRLENGYPGGSFGQGARHTPSELEARGLDVHRGATWPVDATASTSFSIVFKGWGADQVPGRPTVWPRCGDVPGAWAPQSSFTASEWIEARFDPGPDTEVIRIFETDGPGATFAVAVDAGEGLEVVWLRRPKKLEDIARMLEVRLPAPRQVLRVRAWVDGSAVDGWAEIDTISLCVDSPIEGVDPPPEPVPAQHHTGYPGTSLGRGRRYDAKAAMEFDPLVASRGLWPVRASSSSQYSATWAAEAILGRPRVWPRCGDLAGAWAPRPSRSSVEWVEATFEARDMRARAIRVFETNRAGSAYAVSVIRGSDERVVWQDAPIPRLAHACMLEVELDELMPVERVRVYVDNTSSSWSEIDSISLLAVPRGDAYRGIPTRPPDRESVRPAPNDRLASGYDGRTIGEGERYEFFEMLAHDWQFQWRGHWPVNADASSTYGSLWSEKRATGRPGVYPLAGDMPGAWAPKNPRSNIEWLEVAFDAGGHDARAVRVFETSEPGSTFAVSIETPEGQELVWQRPPVMLRGARVLEVDLGQVRRVLRVRIWVDNSNSATWAEIDAIGLVP